MNGELKDPSAETDGVKKNRCSCWKMSFPSSDLGAVTMTIELSQLQGRLIGKLQNKTKYH
jgi:hypothetical protein